MRRSSLLLSSIAFVTSVVLAQSNPADELWIRESGFHFFSGEEVVKTLVVQPSALQGERANLTVSWRLAIGPAVVQRGSFELADRHAEVEGKVVLRMPETRRVMPGALNLSLKQGERQVASRRYQVLLFPAQPSVPRIVKDKRIVLLDPSGKTAAALDFLGIKYVRTSRIPWSMTDLPDLVIVGSNIPVESLFSRLAELKELVEKGVSVLCLEQSHLDGRQFPYLALVEAEQRWDTWVESAGAQPIRGDLPERALGEWRPDGGSVRKAIRAPTGGNFNILLDVRQSAREGKLRSAVIEIPVGKGRYIFSQLLIGERFYQEPMAPHVFVNLLVRALIARAAEPTSVALFANPTDKPMRRAAELLGLKADFNPPATQRYDLALVSGSAASKPYFRSKTRPVIDDLLTFLKGGGTVMILALDPESVEILQPLWKAPLTVSSVPRAGGFDFSTMWLKPLLQGVRLGELQQLCRRAKYPAITFASEVAGARTTASGILMMERGKGQLIVCQLPLPQDESDVSALRTFSQMLTSLGVSLEYPERRTLR